MHSWQWISPVLGLPFCRTKVTLAVYVWILMRSHLLIAGLIFDGIGVLFRKPQLPSYLLNKIHP